MGMNGSFHLRPLLWAALLGACGCVPGEASKPLPVLGKATDRMPGAELNRKTGQPPVVSSSGIGWAKNYDEALATAIREKKLLLIFFQTDWCGWCKRLNAETLTSPAVVAASRQVVGVKLNAEKEGRPQAAAFGVRAFPLVLFLDVSTPEKPTLVGRIEGFSPPGPYSAKIARITQAARDYPVLIAQLDKDPTDLKTLGALVELTHDRGEFLKAASFLNQALRVDSANQQGLLTRALNAVADQYQAAQEYDKAIPLFDKAAKTGRNPVEVAYALGSIATCLNSQGRFTEAIQALKSVVTLKGAPSENRDHARRMIAELSQLESELSASGR